MNVPSGPFLEISPAPGPVHATLPASPSKSATHRAILLGLLSPHAVIDDPLISADTVASLRVAGALGARTSAEPVTDAGRRMLARLAPGGLSTIEAQHADERWEGLVLDELLARASPQVPKPLLAASVRLHVEGGTNPLRAVEGAVDVANSGTTLRIATVLAALGDRKMTLTGDASLLTRPMGPLADALRALGATVECLGADGRPPVQVQGPLQGGTAELPGNVSSQFVSALLIGAQAAPAPVTVRLTTPLRSAPYVEVTEAAIQQAGGTVRRLEQDGSTSFHVPAPVRLGPARFRVPGDYSSAAFPLVAAAITGGSVTLTGLDPDAPQGDRAVIDVLKATGCTAEWIPDEERKGGSLTVTAPSGPLRAFSHGFKDTPDLFPPLAVLASRCQGTSDLHDAAHVRLKECDRVAAMAAGLRAVGISVREAPDALAVDGTSAAPVPPAAIETHDDHRILMAFAILALAGPGPLFVNHPGCYHVSYPRFRLDIDALGGATRVVDREAVLDVVEVQP